MKFKKPYSQYIGKAILYDGRHKHLILRAYKEMVGDFVHFDTICISYTAPKVIVQMSDHAGFMENSPETELEEMSYKEKHLMIEHILDGKLKVNRS